MSTLPEGLTQAEIDRYAKLDAGIKKLQPEHKRLGEKIKSLVVKVGIFSFGSVVVDRNEARSFDKKTAEHDYPFETFPEYYTPVLDPAKVPESVKAKYTSMTPRVSVKVIEQ
jgi:hypothetical protein